MLNKAVIMGRLVRDPELKHTQKGKAYTSLCLAVERNYSRNGEQRQTDFIDCEAWKQTAEFICKYFRKGQMIAISGSIQTGGYTDQNGNKRKTVFVKADEVNFCESKGGNKYDSSNGKDQDFSEIPDNEDLPF